MNTADIAKTIPITNNTRWCGVARAATTLAEGAFHWLGVAHTRSVEQHSEMMLYFANNIAGGNRAVGEAVAPLTAGLAKTGLSRPGGGTAPLMELINAMQSRGGGSGRG